MKKLLALVLALVMTLGLATVGTNAAVTSIKDYTDKDDINKEEAVAVMTAIGVLEGNKGTFYPTEQLRRNEAAKIISYLHLGNATAAALTGTGKFTDVPATNWAAGYVDYLAGINVISGKSSTSFAPNDNLQAVEFAKMLLGVLGYSSAVEGFTGSDWEINVSRIANLVNLYAGLDGIKARDILTREQAAQMAFNAIKTPLVEYKNSGSDITVNGATVSFAPSSYSYVVTTLAEEQRISRDTVTNTGLNQYGGFAVEYGERYYPKLKLVDDYDDFGRPARRWSYDGKEVGTFACKDQLLGSWTEAIDGDTLWKLLGTDRIKQGEVEYFLDGEELDYDIYGDDIPYASNMVKGNDDGYAFDGNGVLTEVYSDGDDLRIVAINTFLGSAVADYSETKETLSVELYNPNSLHGSQDTLGDAQVYQASIKADDIPEVKTVKEGTDLLFTAVYNTNTSSYEIKTCATPNFVNDVKVSKFTTGGYIVVNGTQSDYARKRVRFSFSGEVNPLAFYSEDVKALTDYTYDVIYDSYGYVIGVKVHEGNDSYVFLAGYDLSGSNIAGGYATANLIFTDGTMKTAKVNVTETDKRINSVYNATQDTELRNLQNGKAGTYGLDAGYSLFNRWFTYSEAKDGSYTLTPVSRHLEVVTSSVDDIVNPKNINKNRAGLLDNSNAFRAYGDDNSIYLTVNTDLVSKTKMIGISEVEGTYTGVQNVNLRLYTAADTEYDGLYDDAIGEDVSVYAIYNTDNRIIAAIVYGEDTATSSNYAVAVKGAQNEYVDENGYYYWDFKAITEGEYKTLTVKEKFNRAISDAIRNHLTLVSDDNLFKLSYDKDGYVVGATLVTDDTAKVYGNTEFAAATSINVLDSHNVYDVNYNVLKDDGVYTIKGDTIYSLSESNARTLKSNILADVGLTIKTGAPIWVDQWVNGGESVESYTTFTSALNSLADKNDFNGVVYAALTDGRADWVVIVSYDEVNTKGNAGTTSGVASVQILDGTGLLRVRMSDGSYMDQINVAFKLYMLTSNGYELVAEQKAAEIVSDVTCVGDIASTFQGNSYKIEIGGKMSNPMTINVSSDYVAE